VTKLEFETITSGPRPVSHCALGSEIPGVVRPAFGVTPVTAPMQITS
jgi:hypothetical protein